MRERQKWRRKTWTEQKMMGTRRSPYRTSKLSYEEACHERLASSCRHHPLFASTAESKILTSGSSEWCRPLPHGQKRVKSKSGPKLLFHVPRAAGTTPSTAACRAPPKIRAFKYFVARSAVSKLKPYVVVQVVEARSTFAVQEGGFVTDPCMFAAAAAAEQFLLSVSHPNRQTASQPRSCAGQS
mmetsp:Transcript_24380/g.35855  ORF Transcript_24380/g.35855 Transcript_24380/m.35855 type:complete len:184 (-) Transcript_24380:70-621(-)